VKSLKKLSGRPDRKSHPAPTLCRGILVLLALAALHSFNARVWAQQVTADIVGRVTDLTGALVPGAQVTITNAGTHEMRKAMTNGQGEFTFNLLQIGSYKAQVEAVSFKSVEIPVFALTVGERHRLDIQMEVGSQLEQVVVTSEAAALQTDSASVGQTLESQAVQDLPTQGRNLYSLVQLAPGASAGPANGVSSGQRPDDRRQASEVSANGQSDSRNNNLLDGMDNNSRVGNIIIVRPSIDAVEELSVLTSSYPAEAGNVAGAVVNMLTKSGSNDFHGTAYEYFRNDLFDGRDYFSAGLPKPELRQNQFGGSVGGPIRHDKTFFFADAEDFRKIRGGTTTTTVPTLYEEQHPGDFSDSSDPATVPSYMIDPVGQALFNLYPAPTKAGLINNFTASPNGTQYVLTADARVDHHFGANDLMFGRYSYNKADTLTPGLFPAVNGIQPGGNIYGFEGTAHQTAMNGMLNYTHIFKPNLILELKEAYTRYINQYVTLNEGNNVSTKLGVSNININSSTTGLTDVYPIIDGYASLGDSTYEPGTIVFNDFQEAAILSYSKGTHSIKAGASLIRRQLNENTEGTYPVGNFLVGFDSLFGIGIPNNPMADLLYGVALEGQRQNTLVPSYPRFWEIGEFVQDDWRLTPKITLNVGARYDVFTPEADAQNRLANLDLTTSKIILATSSNKTAGVNTDYHDFSPRVGFSASIANRTVVHGAFAMSFFPADTQNTLLQPNPPFASASLSYATVLDSSNIYAGYGLSVMPVPASPGTNLSTYNGALFSKPKNFPSSYMEEFNVSVQQQIGENVITVAYVGELGRKINLAGNYNVDLPAPSKGAVGPTPFAATLPDVTQIDELLPEGASTYHALQTAFTRHFNHGWSVNANYTWSHTIDDIAGSSYVVEPYGLLPGKFSTYDRGNGDLDLRQRFAVSGSYAFPFADSFTGIKKTLFKGWQMNTVAFWQTGSPFTIENGAPEINIGGAALVTDDRPNRFANLASAQAYVAAGVSAGRYTLATSPVGLGSIQCLGSGNTGQCFAPQYTGTAGDAMKNIVTGPYQRRVDLSVFRDFPFIEKTKLQFRAESYDISNSPNLGQPNPDINSTAFNTISNSLAGTDQRVFQFALKFSY
jgi:hypothetical protein